MSGITILVKFLWLNDFAFVSSHEGEDPILVTVLPFMGSGIFTSLPQDLSQSVIVTVPSPLSDVS